MDLDDKNDSMLTWMTQGSKCYEQLKVVHDMNKSGCCEIKPQDALNNSWLRMISTILGREPIDLITINNSELWMTWMTPGCELKDQDDINNLGLLYTLNFVPWHLHFILWVSHAPMFSYDPAMAPFWPWSVSEPCVGSFVVQCSAGV